MKKIVISLLATASLTLLFGAEASKALAPITIGEVEALPMVKAHKFVPTKLADGGSLYMVKGYFDTPRKKIPAQLFLSADLKTGVYGRGYNAETPKEYLSFLPEKISADAAMTIGNGPFEMFVISDPLCPFCKQLELKLHEYSEIATFKIIFLPLTRLHPKAPIAIKQILAQDGDKAREEMMLAIAKDESVIKDPTPALSKEKNKELDEQIARMSMHARDLGAEGTPSIFTTDGEKIEVRQLDMVKRNVEAAKEKAGKGKA